MAASPNPSPQFNNGLVRWIDRRLPIFSYGHKEYVVFPMPRNLNYFWNFGAIATVMLITMIITGLFLSMNYVANTNLAFDSVERIMRDVNYGWLIRYLHANGASMFFVAVYIHIFRGMYYGSYKYPRELLWILGVLIFLLMIATAFTGYVLPWGQMSFWAVTVIVNLFSAIPLVGDSIATWLWGGFSVDNPTLNRFFTLHFFLPFAIFAVVIFHVIALHVTGSNNPDGLDIQGPQDTIPFHPYFTSKDTVGLLAFLLIYTLFVFFFPNVLGHPDNYIPANPLSTPAHIVPEWYFLPFYAILRAIDFDFLWIIPAKLGGFVCMISSIVMLFLLPFLDTSPIRSCRFRPVYKWFLLLLLIDFILLGYLGSQPAEGSFVLMAKLATLWYFLHFLVLTPLLGWFERPLPLPKGIGQSVLDKTDHNATLEKASSQPASHS